MGKRYVSILDLSANRWELLNGHGEPLANDAPSEVYLRFTINDCGTARNSAGELFQPNVTPEMFNGQPTPATMQQMQ